jgi:hypothetical protein
MIERNITEEDIAHVLSEGEEIEYDPVDNRSLLLWWRGKRPIHVVVVTETLKIKRIVTVYEPTTANWKGKFRRRKQT